MRLTELRARDFLSIGDVEVVFRPDPLAVIIVGPNGAGKTNLFRALDFVGDALTWAKPMAGDYAHNYDPLRPPFVQVKATLSKEEIDALVDVLVAGVRGENRMQDIQGLDPNEASRVFREISRRLKPQFRSLFTGEVTFRCYGRQTLFDALHVEIELATGHRPLFAAVHGGLSSEAEPFSGYSTVSLSNEAIRLVLASHPNSLKLGETRIPLSPIEIDEVVEAMDLDWLVNKIWGVRQHPVMLSVDQVQMASLDSASVLPGEFQSLKSYLAARGFYAQAIDLRTLFGLIYRSAVVRLSDSRSPPIDARIRRFDKISTLVSPIDGAKVAETLYRLKNSPTPSERWRFYTLLQAFRSLTSLDFDVVVEVKESSTELRAGERTPWIPFPTATALGERPEAAETAAESYACLRIIGDGVEVPVRFGASGLSELITVLFAALATSDSIVLLDEPALNLHPSKQRELYVMLRQAAKQYGNQLIVITHSPYFINSENAHSVVRCVRVEGATSLRSFAGLGKGSSARLLKLIDRDPKLTEALFSDKVVLLEGVAEEMALPIWLRKLAQQAGLGNQFDAENITWISVGGQKTFGPYAKLLDTWAVPYRAVGDAKARPYLTTLGSVAFNYLEEDFSKILLQHCKPELAAAVLELKPRKDPAKNPAVAARVAQAASPPESIAQVWAFLKPFLFDEPKDAGEGASR